MVAARKERREGRAPASGDVLYGITVIVQRAASASPSVHPCVQVHTICMARPVMRPVDVRSPIVRLERASPRVCVCVFGGLGCCQGEGREGRWATTRAPGWREPLWGPRQPGSRN
jgi:hypothetical protein